MLAIISSRERIKREPGDIEVKWQPLNRKDEITGYAGSITTYAYILYLVLTPLQPGYSTYTSTN